MDKALVNLVICGGILLATNLIIYLVVLVGEKAKEIKNKDLREATIKTLDIIKKCVGATNQTFVKGLKDHGGFDDAAKEEAWNKTKSDIVNILDEESKNLLEKAYGDFNSYINVAIEDEIKRQKERL